MISKITFLSIDFTPLWNLEILFNVINTDINVSNVIKLLNIEVR